jgi:hypothetical protein
MRMCCLAETRQRNTLFNNSNYATSALAQLGIVTVPRRRAHAVDVTDLMRRMVKEDLLKFDGTPLFPERIAYTVLYKLSDPKARLYSEVTRLCAGGFQSRRSA